METSFIQHCRDRGTDQCRIHNTLPAAYEPTAIRIFKPIVDITESKLTRSLTSHFRGNGRISNRMPISVIQTSQFFFFFFETDTHTLTLTVLQRHSTILSVSSSHIIPVITHTNTARRGNPRIETSPAVTRLKRRQCGTELVVNEDSKLPERK